MFFAGNSERKSKQELPIITSLRGITPDSILVYARFFSLYMCFFSSMYFVFLLTIIGSNNEETVANIYTSLECQIPC